MNIQDCPSPNLSDRSADSAIDMVVLHYTGMQSARAAIERMCDPAAEVSAHYMVDEDGGVQAGVGGQKCLACGGKLLAGRNRHQRPVGRHRDCESGARVRLPPVYGTADGCGEVAARDIVARHGIAPAQVVGHSDIAPARKQDPGELFDWQELARQGLAIWPRSATDPVEPADVPDMLTAIGYDPGALLDDVVTAFQRHFVPHAVSGEADLRTRSMIAAVAAIKS